MAGVCSALHHASGQKWTIIIDWIPIAASIRYVVQHRLWDDLSMGSVLRLMIALGSLVVDHVWTPFPVPWGHVAWHLLAALSIDAAYQQLECTWAFKC